MIRVINALLAIIVGVGLALVLYWVLNKLVEMLPTKWVPLYVKRSVRR